MDQLVNIILTNDKVHRAAQRTMLMWAKPGLLAQPPHSLYLEYLWHI